MKTKGSEQKKNNTEQDTNEGFSGENLPADYNPAAKKLEEQTEQSMEKDHTKVERNDTKSTDQ